MNEISDVDVQRMAVSDGREGLGAAAGARATAQLGDMLPRSITYLIGAVPRPHVMVMSATAVGVAV